MRPLFSHLTPLITRADDEQAVYDLAVRYALETAPPPSGGLTIGKSSSPCRFLDDFDPRVRPTNYALPWALRGLLEDRRVRELFDDELVELRETFEVRSSLRRADADRDAGLAAAHEASP